MAYVADAGTGRVVRVPRNAGPGTSKITDQWGGRSFTFVDPVGIDVAPGHQVIVADNATQYTYQLTGPSSSSYAHYAGQNVHSIEVDRGASNSAHANYVIDGDPGMTETFNRNSIGSNPPRYHGGRVYGMNDGTLRLNYDWVYGDLSKSPKKVLLSNVVPGYPYPSRFQTADRIIELKAEAWADVPVHLRLIDPPDFAPYAPAGGWPYTGTNPPSDPYPPELPYEGNDNVVWGWAGGEDYGLSTDPNATSWYGEINVTPGADNTYTYYLKVPPNVSGENFQVEMTKCDPSGNILQDQVVGMSSVYTSWKRIFIERDKMFRSGGVLAEDYVPVSNCGPGSKCVCTGVPGDPPCCSGSGPTMCNQLVSYEWQNASVGDQVAVFDEFFTFETAAEYRTVTAISPGDGTGLVTITLDEAPTLSFMSSLFNVGPPPQPTFTNLHSAGYGVVSGCDLSPKQINQVGPPVSCFYEADMRGIEKPFGDAFVEFFAPRDGMSALPTLPKTWFTNIGTAGLLYFSQTWFEHYTSTGSDMRTNFFHLMGATERLSATGEELGATLKGANLTYIFR